MAKKKEVKKEEKKEKKVTAKKDVKKDKKKEAVKAKKDKFDKLVEELEMEEDFVKKEVNNNREFFDEGEEEIEDIEEEEIDDEDEFEEVVSTKKVSKNNNSNNNQNNTLIFITCASLIVSVVALFISLIILSKVSHIDSFYVEEDDSNQQVESGYDTSMFTSLAEDDFIAMFEEDDDEVRFVFSGRSTCSYCVAFLPYLQQSVEEYDYTLHYLDIDKVSKYDEISDLDDKLAENISYTPMVYAIKNGEVIDINDGYTEYSTLTEFLEENGVEKK